MEADFKKKYRAYAQDEDLPLFFQPWYLDIVCDKGEWGVSLAHLGDQGISGIWPYYIKSVVGISSLALPPLTPYLGPFVLPSRDLEKRNSIRSYERKVLTTLHQNLPKVTRLMAQGYPTWKNWRPLSWLDYQQTTRYTLRIDLRKREEELYKDFKDKIRNQIAQAEQVLNISKEVSAATLFEGAKCALCS